MASGKVTCDYTCCRTRLSGPAASLIQLFPAPYQGGSLWGSVVVVVPDKSGLQFHSHSLRQHRTGSNEYISGCGRVLHAPQAVQ